MIWLVTAALAADRCTPINASDILSIKAPAVIVLGERHGTQPDLYRASYVAKKLNEAAKVTLALEAVHQKFQLILDDYARKKIPKEDLQTRLEWPASWGYPFGPYRTLVRGADLDMDVLGVGVDRSGAPAGEKFPIPSGYLPILHDGMAGSDVAPGLEQRFLETVAWRDYAIARNAVRSWDGTGYLVIVADRAAVEGGKGVAWQAEQLTDKPVHSFVLAWGDTPPCYPGDQVWGRGVLG
jgi:hypothetical protein